MKSKVKRRQEENHKKLQKADKAKKHPNKPATGRFRDTPGGRKLAALRAKKSDEEE